MHQRRRAKNFEVRYFLSSESHAHSNKLLLNTSISSFIRLNKQLKFSNCEIIVNWLFSSYNTIFLNKCLHSSDLKWHICKHARVSCNKYKQSMTAPVICITPTDKLASNYKQITLLFLITHRMGGEGVGW